MFTVNYPGWDPIEFRSLEEAKDWIAYHMTSWERETATIGLPNGEELIWS